jgi:hypothetical protein
MASLGAKALSRISLMSQSGFGTAAAFGTAAGELLATNAVVSYGCTNGCKPNRT